MDICLASLVIAGLIPRIKRVYCVIIKQIAMFEDTIDECLKCGKSIS